MNTNRRTEEVFHEVLRHPAEERPAVLQRLCGTDTEIRREVEALLRADADPGSIPPPRLTSADALNPETWTGAPPAPIGEKPGSVIGRYKLLQQIG